MSVSQLSEFDSLCTAFSNFMLQFSLTDRQIEDLLIPRVRVLNNQLYFGVQLDDIDATDIENGQKFSLMRSFANKYVIPVPPDVTEIATETVIITSEGTRNVESKSVARGGDFILINNPRSEAVSALNTAWAFTPDIEPRERVLSMIDTAKENGCENIFPANASFQAALECSQSEPIVRPALFCVKPSMKRAAARFPGPTIVDQTNQWGVRDDGSRNYQIQPNTVFIVHLDANQRPIMANGSIKANTCELKPFVADYRPNEDIRLDYDSVDSHVPIVQFSGELSEFNANDVKNIAETLLKMNRNLRATN